MAINHTRNGREFLEIRDESTFLQGNFIQSNPKASKVETRKRLNGFRLTSSRAVFSSLT